jgi:hypothetical protein
MERVTVVHMANVRHDRRSVDSQHSGQFHRRLKSLRVVLEASA